jgi:uncharacterized protein YcfJ
VCREVEEVQCNTVAVPVAQSVSEPICVEKTDTKCVTVFDKVCTGSKGNSYQPFTCKKVPREDCRDVKVQVRIRSRDQC